MPDILHLDYEMYSDADLKKVGAFRYANDPSTVILCAAIALNDGEPLTWVDGTYQSPEALNLFLRASREPDLLIYAHNAMFEIAITDALWRRTFGFAPPQHMQWRCTAAMARKAALPAKLETVANKLNLLQRKDTRGASLINKFCKSQRVTKKRPAGGRLMPAEEPEAFSELVAYCAQDVRTEQAVHEKLKAFEWKGSSLDMFQLDIAINTRGLPVNIEGLTRAQELVDSETTRIAQEFRELTGFEHTQGAKFLAWLKERGYSGENLTADTIEDEVGEDSWDVSTSDLFPEAVLALRLKQRVSFASIKKIKAMLACAGPHDNRVRGTLICHGPTTGRWAGSLIQPQNFKRPTMDQTEQAYADICGGMGAVDLEMFYGSPLEVLSSCMRHFIHDIEPYEHKYGLSFEDKPMLDADYAAIEGRIVCWLAGQEDALEEYRADLDRYITMSTAIFPGTTYAEILAAYEAEDRTAKDQRFIGKQAVLGCGYGMGPPKFRGTCENLGFHKLPKGMEFVAVHAFRKKHPKLSAYPDENGENAGLWHQAEQSCISAIKNPGNKYHIGPHCRAFSARTAGMHCLFIVLPSGRALCYPEAAVVNKIIPAVPASIGYRMEDGELVAYTIKARAARQTQEITFYGQLPKSVLWGRVSTYGGKLVENCLSGSTRVKTATRGWVRLDQVKHNELVWDGQSFVCQGGLVCKGWRNVVNVHGVLATPEHLFMDENHVWCEARTFSSKIVGTELVYDLLDCGPRHRFVVRKNANSRELIAHNCTQAVAADIMANGACNAERAGYEIAALIHDEALAYYAPERGQSIGEFIKLLTTLPKWADGLPIEAEGDVVPFYKK